MESTSARKAELITWLQAMPQFADVTLHPLKADASFRSYYRISAKNKSYVVMDAPPATENTAGFVAVDYALSGMGLTVPEILAADMERGFLVLTDFGDQTVLHALKPENADYFYGEALDALAILQACPGAIGYTLPRFDAAFMQKEWEWHREWVLERWLYLTPTSSEQASLDSVYEALIQSAVSQPQVFMHRDYHAGNLMALARGGIAILDFQDAFIGPLTYDLASLLRDCYIAWPEPRVYAYAASYLDRLQGAGLLTAVDEALFLRWFDWMGLERHLKAMMTFVRKHLRDDNPAYLKFIPRTLNYILTVSERYAELKPLHAYYANVVSPAISEVMPVCVS